ncbi:MAG: hypothetical protein RL153_2586 [Verrucomicrobiota bacterium]
MNSPRDHSRWATHSRGLAHRASGVHAMAHGTKGAANRIFVLVGHGLERLAHRNGGR